MLCIDPGHGGSDPGCVANGLQEKDLTLTVGLSLYAALAACGVEAKLTRHNDARLQLSQRGAAARAANATQVLCVHFDTNPDPRVGRLTCYCAAGDRQSQALAAAIPECLPAWLTASSRAIFTEATGWKRRAHNVVSAFQGVPTLLVECAFVSNHHHAQALQRAAGRTALVACLMAGLSATILKPTASSFQMI